jgi:hypothetical protein
MWAIGSPMPLALAGRKKAIMQQGLEFNPREHLMTIKNKQGAVDYLPVQWRLVWFRTQCPEGTIATEVIHLDLDKAVESEIMQWDNQARTMKPVTKQGVGVAVFKATITDGHGGSATGYGSEKASDFGDFLEKAETKAIGRALAALGYGTQFAPELNEEHRIVDAPVDSQANGTAGTQGNGQASTGKNAASPVPNSNARTITQGQRESIRKACEALGRPQPEHVAELSELGARTLIGQLNAEYRQTQTQQSRAS